MRRLACCTCCKISEEDGLRGFCTLAWAPRRCSTTSRVGRCRGKVLLDRDRCVALLFPVRMCKAIVAQQLVFQAVFAIFSRVLNIAHVAQRSSRSSSSVTTVDPASSAPCRAGGARPGSCTAACRSCTVLVCVSFPLLSTSSKVAVAVLWLPRPACSLCRTGRGMAG